MCMKTRVYYYLYWNGEYCYSTIDTAFSSSNVLFFLPSFPPSLLLSFPLSLLPFLLPSLPLSLSRSDTFAILVFHWTFALDLSSLYIAELEEDDEEKGKVREEKGKESEKQKLPSNLLVQ